MMVVHVANRDDVAPLRGCLRVVRAHTAAADQGEAGAVVRPGGWGRGFLRRG